MGICKGRTQQPAIFPPPRQEQGSQGTGAAPIPGIGHIPGNEAVPRLGWDMDLRVEGLGFVPSEGNQGQTWLQEEPAKLRVGALAEVVPKGRGVQPWLRSFPALSLQQLLLWASQPRLPPAEALLGVCPGQVSTRTH